MENKGYANFLGADKVHKEVVQEAYNRPKQVKTLLSLLAMENCKWIKEESYLCTYNTFKHLLKCDNSRLNHDMYERSDVQEEGRGSGGCHP